MLFILTKARSGLYHSNMKDFVFKDSTKKWLTYTHNLLATSLIRATSPGCMTSQNAITSYLMKRTLGIAHEFTSLDRQLFKLIPISYPEWESFQENPEVIFFKISFGEHQSFL